MILIRRSTTNTVYLTLKEKTTLTSPQFLLRFTNQATNTRKVFIAADTSSFTNRYNQLSITENNTEVLTGGIVQLQYVGLWNYEIYEQPSGANTLNVAQATSLLETGIVKVRGNTAENTWQERNFINNDTYIERGSGTAA